MLANRKSAAKLKNAVCAYLKATSAVMMEFYNTYHKNTLRCFIVFTKTPRRSGAFVQKELI